MMSPWWLRATSDREEARDGCEFGEAAVVAPAPGIGLDVGGVTGELRDRKSGRGLRGLKRSLRRHWQLYLLLLVPIAYFVVFKYIPMANTIIAFKDYNVVDGVWGSDWAGLRHFERFFSNPIFWPVLRNTFMLSAYVRARELPDPDHPGTGAERSASEVLQEHRADGDVRAVLHLDGRGGVHDDPVPLAPRRPRGRRHAVLRPRHHRLPERPGLLPPHLRAAATSGRPWATRP